MSHPVSKADIEAAKNDVLRMLGAVAPAWLDTRALRDRSIPGLPGRALGVACKLLVDEGQLQAVRGPGNVFIYRKAGP